MSSFIAYHGTNSVNARNIRKQGFKTHTYFALHLEDALEFGGSNIFEVTFPRKIDEDDLIQEWQFVTSRPISANRIVSHSVYKSRKLYDDSKLREKVFKSNTS